MKVRVLYPTNVQTHVEDEVQAGDVIDLPAEIAEALIGEGAAEKDNAKPADHPQAEQLGHVEAATAAPGQKSRARRPAKK